MPQLLRSFLPLHNPIGFSATDFVELVLTLGIVLFTWLWRPRVATLVENLAQRTWLCMLLLAALPVALRLALQAHNPVPTPAVSDDFSYLLLADTLRHIRLANPAHPLPQFFETFFVLQEPTYSSIFPLGQGLVLALGWIVFGHPWAGVAVSIGALSAMCYWMLLAWVPAEWALLGGLLTALQFGPLNQWMNSYWGGAVSAVAGCLVFGALPRHDGVLLGLGLALQLLTRPFESIFLFLSVLLFRPRLRASITAAVILIPALGLILLQNRAVTGSWTTLPYMASRYQYGVPTTFTFQPNPVPHRPMTREQELDYEIQSKVHGPETDSFGRFVYRLYERLPFYRFFLFPALLIPVLVYVAAIRDSRSAWVVITILMFALGTNVYPYFYTHYIAAITCLFILMSVAGLLTLSQFVVRRKPVGRDAATIVVILCFTHFLFWYGIHLSGDETLLTATDYEAGDAINYGDPDGRIAINHQLAAQPGGQLVFVRYGAGHTFREWVHDAADIDASHTVWARDLGALENEKLLRYYPQRTAWLLEPDAKPPRLVRYQR
jgi:hypothetical protein